MVDVNPYLFWGLVGLVVGVLTVALTLWGLHARKYKSGVIRRSTHLDFARGHLTKRKELTLEKPERFAYRKHMTIDSIHGELLPYVRSASLFCDGDPIDCELVDRRWRSEAQVRANLTELIGSRNDLILVTEFELSRELTLPRAEPAAEQPMLTRSEPEDTIEGRTVRKSVVVTKRFDIKVVSKYIERFTLPGYSWDTLKVTITENGRSREMDPKYLTVSRSDTLEEFRAGKGSLDQKGHFDLELSVDLRHVTTLICVTYEKP